MIEVNMETVRFVDMLNRLAELTNNRKFIPFSKWDGESDCIVYDDAHGDESAMYPIVLDSYCNDEHHDVVSTWDMFVSGFRDDIRVRAYTADGSNSDAPNTIIVTIPDSKMVIDIYDGVWRSDGV